jgi:hypothetical protein
MSNETLEKPPIGVMPLWLWRELHPNPTPAQIFTREMEVMFAIDRYVAAGFEPLAKWWSVEEKGGG